MGMIIRVAEKEIARLAGKSLEFNAGPEVKTLKEPANSPGKKK